MRRRAVLLLTLMTMALVAVASPAYAKTFTVNATSDREDKRPGNGSCYTGVRIVHENGGIEPECTLRAAIQEANKFPGADTINFGILSRRGTNCDATTKVCTISPATFQLPPIKEPTTINGYSQPGAKVNTATTGTNAKLKIVLDGSKSQLGTIGLLATGSNITVKGLVINNGFNTGVSLFPEGFQPGGNRLEGSFIGTDATGTTAKPNLVGVFPTGFATGKNEVVGGNTLAARNLISGNTRSGLELLGLATVEGNLIGTKKDGTTALGNGEDGVAVLEGSNNTIARNTIAFNGQDGVEISEDEEEAGRAVGNRILSNSIFSNGLLGIDLSPNGVNGNDFQDPDTGPNRLQNFPLLASAQRSLDRKTTITGSLNSTPGNTFTIQFFGSSEADATGFGEGKTFLGEIQVTTNATGGGDPGGDTGTFTFTTNPGAVSEGQFVAATATSDSTGDTSEFSGARIVKGPVIDPG